jgi:hypothetical protein
MGTLVCLGQVPVDRRAFLVQRIGDLTGIVDELRQLLTPPDVPVGGDIAPLLRGMANVTETLREAFLVLEQFRSLPAEAVRLATRAIADGYWSIRVQVQCIGMCLALPIRYWEGSRAERESYYQGILDGLYDRCCQERDTAFHPSAVP